MQHAAPEYVDILKKKNKILTHLLAVWNCSNIFIPVLFPFTLTLMRMKNTSAPLYCAAFIVDCFMSVKFRFLLNLSSFTQGHTLLLYQHPPGYLKHKHAFHYDFWHDPKCDRNNFIQFWLMRVLTWARNLVIPDKQPSGDIIKSVGGEKKMEHRFVHPRWSAYALNSGGLIRPSVTWHIWDGTTTDTTVHNVLSVSETWKIFKCLIKMWFTATSGLPLRFALTRRWNKGVNFACLVWCTMQSPSVDQF